MPTRPLLALLVAASCTILAAPSAGQEPVARTYLLHVSKGQLPSDTGQEDKTVPEIVNQQELGGKALKVSFAAGDSFGARAGSRTDWKPFARLRFNAWNPDSKPISLDLTVVHARSTSYQTRVIVPIKLQPGKNEVTIDTDEMANVNGSRPDMAHIVRWYIADTPGKAPTVYFSDIWLEKSEAAANTPSGPGGQPGGGYRIKGKVGGQDVDLIATPIGTEPSGAASGTGGAARVHGDPARLSRLRAAHLPAIKRPVEFFTPEADAILSALEVFPPDNPWNMVVEDWPVHPDSGRMIASIGPQKPFRYNPDMGFILIPPDQKKVPVRIVGYPGESDRGPFPVPDRVPIEGWPAGYRGRTVSLDDVQRDRLNEDGDRHAIVVDPVNRRLYEFYQLRKTDSGWQAAQSSVFDLASNRMRPDSWTSTDAAGLPIFPSIVRYDELKRGLVEHAMRVTVTRSRKSYVYPARHHAGHGTADNLPRMGERLRLRRDFDVSGFSPEVQAILKGLKKYGMFVADNGIDWAISVAPDPRIPGLADELRKIKGSDFEVIQAPPGYTPPDPD